MEALKNNSQAIVRALTVAVAVVLQAITMVLVGRYLHEYASWAYVLLEIISFLLVFGLINDQESYRQFWCVIVLVFPVTGLFLYYMWGRRRRNSKTHIMIRETEAKMRQYVPHQPEVMEELHINIFIHSSALTHKIKKTTCKNTNIMIKYFHIIMQLCKFL